MRSLRSNVVVMLLSRTLATACAANASDLSRPDPPRESAATHATKEAALGESFALKVGEIASIKGESLLVGFVEVTADSRCAKGVQCVWEGDAVARFEVQLGAGEKKSRDVHISGKNDDTEGSSFRVRLERLDPHPVSGQHIDARDYVATVQVIREQTAESR